MAPYRRDAEYLSGLLKEHDIEVALSDGNRLAEHMREAAGVLVTTHEALTPEVIDAVRANLGSQPPWSEMPIVILLDRSSPNALIRSKLAHHWPRARLLYYERPVSAVELLSGIQSALLVRLRQRDVRDHIDREVELRRELNHRVKNILASVASIFQMTHRGASTVEDLATDFSGRLQALSNVHSAVFDATGEAVSMREITDLTFAPYRLHGADRVTAVGEDFRLSGENSTTMALCLHELTTNAIKYGALSVATGQVTFQWAIVEGQLSIDWTERDGPPVVAPTRSGYGTRFLRSALANLFGASPIIEFDPRGLRCAVTGSAEKVFGNL
ncbi:MAG: sensor histidine kinase [Alphaproteobacteria bacterium]|nr:MAG: sensor histidine kinase [Alphaproteobacteria bacterium]